MKVLFVNQAISLYINVGLTYVMSSVAQRHQVCLVDRMKQKSNFYGYLKHNIKHFVPDVIAFSVNSYTISDALPLIRQCKQDFPEVKIILGGIQPTILPEETIVIPGVDAICIGEGEESFLEYLDCRAIGAKGIAGIWFKGPNGDIVRNPSRPFLEDLDILPFPRWDLWDIEGYLNDGEIFPGTLRVAASRGCPFSCAFCTNPVWPKAIPGKYYRKRKPEKIIEEIQQNIARYKSKGFSFLMMNDSIFGLDRNHTETFCYLYRKQGLEKVLPWGAQMRCGTVDKAYARMLKASGCSRITVSIESGSDYMRNDVYRKNLTKDQIRETIEALRQCGIYVRGFIMIGGPGETSFMFEETRAFLKQLSMTLSDVTVIRYVPLPKTQLASVLPEDIIRMIHSPFCYHTLSAVKSDIPAGYYFKLKVLKILSFLRQGLILRGIIFLFDIIKVAFRSGKSRFIPLVHICSEQRMINWTIARYHMQKII